MFKSNNPRPDLIKIDIEGGGVKAIPSMNNVLKDCQPIIFMELHGYEEAQVAWKVLKDCGYKIVGMKRGYPEFTNFETLRWKEYIIGIPSNNKLHQ